MTFPEILAEYDGEHRLAMAICILNQRDGSSRINRTSSEMTNKNLFALKQKGYLLGNSQTGYRVPKATMQDVTAEVLAELTNFMEANANASERDRLRRDYQAEKKEAYRDSTFSHQQMAVNRRAREEG